MYAVVGLGQTGYSCVRYLVSQGHEVMVCDTREQPPYLADLQTHYPLVPVYCGGLEALAESSVSVVVVSPGVSLAEPALVECRARDIPMIGDIELFSDCIDAPIIAVTGSNGKTTVVTLLGEMLQAAGRRPCVCGNVGLSVLDVCLEGEPADIYILELSSFQLETTHTLSAEVSVLLNVSPDHMDRYVDEAAYLSAKQRIYHGCRHAVVNADDVRLWSDIPLPDSVTTFGVSDGVDAHWRVLDHDGVSCVTHCQSAVIPVSELRLFGEHQLENVLAACAAASLCGVADEDLAIVLRSFTGLPHRCEWVGYYSGADWYNDSKGTNIGATLAAIDSVYKAHHLPLVLVAGGQGKGADFSELQSVVSRCVGHAIVFGEDRDQLSVALAGVCEVHSVSDMSEAVLLAERLVSGKGVVLLSPACASFDMFDHYQHRGDVFKDLVRRLCEENSGV